MINFFEICTKELPHTHLEKDIMQLRTYGLSKWYDYSKVMRVIKTDTYFSFYYARDIIKCRFAEGEPAIMKSPSRIFFYAYEVIKGRWPEAEEHILKEPEYAYLYARSVIKGRWPEAEEHILKEPEYVFRYAKFVIKGRWPEAEPYLNQRREFWWDQYCRYVGL